LEEVLYNALNLPGHSALMELYNALNTTLPGHPALMEVYNALNCTTLPGHSAKHTLDIETQSDTESSSQTFAGWKPSSDLVATRPSEMRACSPRDSTR